MDSINPSLAAPWVYQEAAPLLPHNHGIPFGILQLTGGAVCKKHNGKEAAVNIYFLGVKMSLLEQV